MGKAITRAKGGEMERLVDVDTLQVPDLWHIASYLHDKGHPQAAEATKECWYLCHDLLRHVRES